MRERGQGDDIGKEVRVERGARRACTRQHNNNALGTHVNDKRESDACSGSKQSVQKLQFVWLHADKGNTMLKMDSAQKPHNTTARQRHTTTQIKIELKLATQGQGEREAGGSHACSYLLVISGNAVHAALDENEAELGVLNKHSVREARGVEWVSLDDKETRAKRTIGVKCNNVTQRHCRNQ
jgi:hypothetical protein